MGNANNQPKRRANDNACEQSRNLAFKISPLMIDDNSYFATVVSRPSRKEKNPIRTLGAEVAKAKPQTYADKGLWKTKGGVSNGFETPPLVQFNIEIRLRDSLYVTFAPKVSLTNLSGTKVVLPVISAGQSSVCAMPLT